MAAMLVNNLPIKLNLENNRIVVQKDSVSEGSDSVFDGKIYSAVDSDSGLSGDYYTLTIESSGILDNEKHQNRELFIKSVPLRYPIECDRVKHWKLFQREKIMYSIIDDVIGEKLNNDETINVYPRPYSITENFIVMENIKSLGYKRLDKIAITPDITKICLDSLANMHAHNIVLVVSKDDQQYLHNDSPLNHPIIVTDNPWVQTGISAILKLAVKDPRNQSEKRKQFIEEKLACRINSIFDLPIPDKSFKVVSHCDLRPKNIFLKTDEKEPQSYTQCIFVDYQEARHVPPAIDVLFFLYYNLRKPIITDDLITEYSNYYFEKLNDTCQTLNLEIEKYLSLDSFREIMDQYRPLAKLMRALHAPFLCEPGFAPKLRLNDIESYVNCMVGDRSPMIDQLCEENPTNEKFIFECNQAVVDIFNTNE